MIWLIFAQILSGWILQFKGEMPKVQQEQGS